MINTIIRSPRTKKSSKIASNKLETQGWTCVAYTHIHNRSIDTTGTLTMCAWGMYVYRCKRKKRSRFMTCCYGHTNSYTYSSFPIHNTFALLSEVLRVISGKKDFLAELPCM